LFVRGLVWFVLICTAFAVGLIIMPCVLCEKRFQFFKCPLRGHSINTPNWRNLTFRVRAIFQPLWAGNHFKTETDRFDFKQFFEETRRVSSNNTSKTKTSVLVLNNFLIAPYGGVQ
jgi:hypothetical protein